MLEVLDVTKTYHGLLGVRALASARVPAESSASWAPTGQARAPR